MNFQVLDGIAPESVASWFFDRSREGFAISRGGVILAVNQAWCDILGVTAEDAVGQTATDILSARDLALHPEREARLRARGEDEFEVRLDTARGSVWVEGSVRRGADGYALILARDVTQERRMAAERGAAAHIQSLLWGRAGILTWTFSPSTGQFHVDATRDAVTDMYVPGARRVALNDMLQKMEEDQRQSFVVALSASVARGDPQEYAFRYNDDEGRVRRFTACWRGLRQEDDGRWRLAGLTRDLTELMEARDSARAGERLAKEAGRVKSRFLANMSHEFRTPLNGMLGVLHLLKSEPVSADARRLLDEAAASGRVLTSLLNSLLDLADLDADRLNLFFEEVAPAALLTEVVATFRAEAQAKGLTLEAITAPDAPRVVADRERLSQVLANLVGNAVKFTEQGGVVVRLIVLGAGSGQKLRLEIEDTGIGLAPDMLSRIFETFSQADDGATRQFGGVGSGLSLSRSLARLMGGDVHATSTPGKGSTFVVELPVLAPSIDRLDPASHAPLEGLSVLVVDDNATNRLVASRIVEQLGAKADTASDGAQAVKAVVGADFDLVLMDIQMPVMDGVEATRTIRALSAPVSQVPIVAVTANVAPDQVAGYAAAGMNGVIAKPVSPTALLTEIVRLTAAPLDAVVHRLIYCSRVSQTALPRVDGLLAEILSEAQPANRAADLTGALLGCGGWFLQTLEGPEAAVETTFARILVDGRHEAVTRLSSGDVDGRLFGGWAMIGQAFSPTDAAVARFLTRSAGFDPRTQTTGACLDLLLAVGGLRTAASDACHAEK